jgi:hypothetical protein
VLRLCVIKIKGWRIAQPRRRFGGSRLDRAAAEFHKAARRQGLMRRNRGCDRDTELWRTKRNEAGGRDAVCSGELWIWVLVEARLHENRWGSSRRIGLSGSGTSLKP